MKKILIFTLMIHNILSAAQFTQAQMNELLYPKNPATEKYHRLFEESEAYRAEIFKAAGWPFSKKELEKAHPTANDYLKAFERSQEFIEMAKEELQRKNISLPTQIAASTSSDSPFIGDTIDPDNYQDNNEAPASKSGWMSSLWNYGSSKASQLSNALGYAKDSLYTGAGYLKNGVTSAAGYAAKVATNPYALAAAALYTTGAGDRLANLAGWKYDRMSDYPYAKKGNYVISISFPSLANSGPCASNPICNLSFKNNKLVRNEFSCDLYRSNHINHILENNLFKEYANKETIYDKLYTVFKELFDNIKANVSSHYTHDGITLQIDVGIEDESGTLSNKMHLFNRRWLSPITNYFSFTTDTFATWFNNFYNNELKQRIMP